MPSASPFLHEILDRWVDRRTDRENEHSVRQENLTLLEHTLDVGSAGGRQQRRGDVVELESIFDAAATRWNERLRRLNEWTERLESGRQQLSSVDRVVARARWLDRWESKTPRWIAQLLNRADHCAARHQSLTVELEQWVAGLDMRLFELDKFANDQGVARQAALLVSRARKEPEVMFVEDQFLTEAALGQRLQGLRHTASLFLGRILAGQRTLQKGAEESPALFEPRRHLLRETWLPIENRWRALRDDILKDALIFEGGRRRLRTLRDLVRGLRCVEDAYQAQPAVWKKILTSFSIK